MVLEAESQTLGTQLLCDVYICEKKQSSGLRQCQASLDLIEKTLSSANQGGVLTRKPYSGAR